MDRQDERSQHKNRAKAMSVLSPVCRRPRMSATAPPSRAPAATWWDRGSLRAYPHLQLPAGAPPSTASTSPSIVSARSWKGTWTASSAR
ncbi:hypothetical protein H2136_17615 [Aeromonas hydrophila]|uniref:Uncharacterized protein n=1 Tax=Aeromonas hydrophila TaxID=644 RepID=A0A926IZ40_AERHY|nr:hypothetical protein [Aeromonas hydrophila]